MCIPAAGDEQEMLKTFVENTQIDFAITSVF